MADELYRKPIAFAIVATVVILIGTVVTMFVPMLTPQMHPKLENLKPFTPLELAGRDIYQREGCNNCHTQTVRPLKTEVMRYGEYSKAGEFAFDYPFLWGSKRTGPDLARIGGKYPDAWHYRHFEEKRLTPEKTRRHMNALGFPYSEEDISVLQGKNELDALVAYMQVIGTAITKKKVAEAAPEVTVVEMLNPLAGDPNAVATGEDLYEENCSICHGDNGEGDIGPSLIDTIVVNVEGDLSDAHYMQIISNGLEEGMVLEGRSVAEGGMPPFGEELSKDEIWSLISFIRSIQGK
jgi:cytochrome c oxidase cbb3-type subunit 2